MSDERSQCDRFDEWLVDAAGAEEAPEWSDHLAACEGCRAQWRTHRMLTATFAGEAVPELTPGFEAGLERKLDAAIEIRPLTGWRRAAMLGYLAAGAGGLGWLLRDSPLWSAAPSTPWVTVATFVAIPLTFLLAIAASRWIPTPRGSARARALAL